MRTTKIKKITVNNDLQIKNEEIFSVKEIRVSKKHQIVLRILGKNYLINPNNKELEILK